MLSCSQSLNSADVSPELLHCWAVPNLVTSLSHILSYYNSELFSVLKHCRCTPSLNTLLKSSKTWNLEILLTYYLSCYIAELFHSGNIPDVYLVSLLRWAVSNPKKLLSRILSFYVAEIFTILKHFWVISCLITMLSYSQFWNPADVYPVIIHCWNAPNVETLLTYTLSYYIAELFPIFKQCWRIPWLFALLSCS